MKTLVKGNVLKKIASLFSEFFLDDLIERLIVLEKIELGLEQVAEGKTTSTAEACKKLGLG